MLSPPGEEVACLGNACLVDAAIGSKLTPRRAEHVTQGVCVCLACGRKRAAECIFLSVARSSIPEWNMHCPLMEIARCAGSTITDAVIMRAQLSYIST